jgi:uncharacterized protein YdeI (YjbR/CyaY-like superfamily)
LLYFKGIWTRFFKKASVVSSINTSGALDVVLCYGWIHRQARPYDERSRLGRFAPRRPKSIWSKMNIKRAEILISHAKNGESRRMKINKMIKMFENGKRFH